MFWLGSEPSMTGMNGVGRVCGRPSAAGHMASEGGKRGVEEGGEVVHVGRRELAGRDSAPYGVLRPVHCLAPKFCVHQGPPLPLWMPTPMSLNAQLRMLARWPGLFIQESITASGVCWPMAMFSPYVDQV